MTTLHPSAWLAWLAATAVFALVVTNPLYLVLAFAAIMVVHLSFPPDDSPVARAVRVFLLIGVVLLGFRLVFVSLLTDYGTTTLFVVPRIQTPSWLGGFGVGGAVTAEVLVTNAIEGFRLIVVLVAFGVFNARADLGAIVRSVPSGFRDVGLVVCIAVAFVPGMLQTVRDVRDAQRLRGEWGLRRLAPSLAVPVLGMSLERSMTLAESMDARGYGRGEATMSGRWALWAGLVLPLVGLAVWVAGWGPVGAAVALAGGAALAWSFRAASVASSTTRLATRRVSGFDLWVILASLALVTGLLAAGGWSEEALSYGATSSITLPPFDLAVAAVTFLLMLPAFVRSR
jgi:energy-coupling factor transport system permease protein